MLKPELLAPAGDYKSFMAAIKAGADAVYFGGRSFNARALAANLSNEEISRAIDEAHLIGVKCYAAVNTLVKDTEISGLFDFINFLYAEGVDALIVQDLGVSNLCRKYWPDLSLHASTQMTAHNLNDVLLLKKLGFSRVVLSRELTLTEVKEIKEKSGVEIEAFVHGALCFSYSGRCLMSSMIGGRSGNRGRCAQPCRKRYVLYDKGNDKVLEENGYLLSTRDMCTLEIFDKLKFIDSLKIEGRMKNPEYVTGVVSAYRRYLDTEAAPFLSDIEKDKLRLATIFNRGGFSTGYWQNKKPQDLISPERSKNFGVKVGTVISYENKIVKLKVENVKINDGLEIWGSGGQENNTGFRVERVSDGIIEKRLEGNIKPGDMVYKTFDYALNKELGRHAKENCNGRIPVKMEFMAEENQPLVLRINDIEVTGIVAQKALKVPTARETIEKQLNKLGGTPFYANEIKINAGKDLNIPLKDINELRRKGVTKLAEAIIRSSKRTKKSWQEKNTGVISDTGKSKKICVQTDDASVLDMLADKKISRIYTGLRIDIEKFHKNNIEVFQTLPGILRSGEKLEIFSDYDGFLVPSLGYLEILPDSKKKIADYSLYAFNRFAAEELKKLGFAALTTSPESTLAQINSLDADGITKEVIIYGRIPLMIAEHCVLFKTKHCRKKGMSIQDETGTVFPLFTDCTHCRMQLINSAPLYFTELKKLAADSVRFIHTIESPQDFIDRLDRCLAGDLSDKRSTTCGHFYHEVE